MLPPQQLGLSLMGTLLWLSDYLYFLLDCKLIEGTDSTSLRNE